MDFGTLLHMAKKNSDNKKSETKYYSTRYAPPKKETKDKKLSENIQKFLQKREQEERERQREEKQKLTNLLAMRDEKSKNKIRKMLKVTKSANKSVLDDAVNDSHTAVTMDGPDQPDQDDYGYVSTEANAFYQKYIEKVKDVQEDKGFAPSRPQSLKDLSGTKERVKAAITKEAEDKKTHTRQRISNVSSSSTNASASTSTSSASQSSKSKSLYDPEAEKREEDQKRRDEEKKRSQNRKPMPPPMDFHALLKLAEKKQHEPVEILMPEVKKKKEPERLLTSKEKREWEERQRAKEEFERRRQQRERERERNLDGGKDSRKPVNGSSTGGGSGGAIRMEPNGRIPKLNQKPNANQSTSSATTTASSSSIATSNRTSISSATARASSSIPSHNGGSNNVFKKPNSASAVSSKNSLSSSSKNVPSVNSKPSSASTGKSSISSSPSVSKPSSSSSSAPSSSKPLSSSSSSSKIPSNIPSVSSHKNSHNGTSREFPPRDIKSMKARPDVQKTRQFPPPDVQKTRQFPPPDVHRSRQFPPSDVRRGVSNRPSDNRKPQASKRRILDDDDEDEYDSEMDDFIDDGDCEEDYSTHIKEIFGYDKSKYRYVDDDDDDAMESNFAQVQREEYISKKIGLQEDLEDMKLEAMEKKRKHILMNKKKKLHD